MGYSHIDSQSLTAGALAVGELQGSSPADGFCRCRFDLFRHQARCFAIVVVGSPIG